MVSLQPADHRRRRNHVLPVRDETEPFRLVSDSVTPVAMEMDPRTEEGHLAEFEPEENVEAAPDKTDSP